GGPSGIKSSDTIASLAEVPAAHLYDRLALWLLDASASEMQEFWTSYTAREDRTNDLNDLVFINWTRVDPEAAIAAAEGTEFSKYPWWAWACHEPEKALSEVLARYQGQENMEHIGEVAWGLGEFHPAWLRDNLDDLPEKWMRDRALSGYVKFADTENPRESIEFLKSHRWNIDQKTIAAFGRDDPLAAYQLALELKGNDDNYRYHNLPDQLVDSLAAEDPILLNRLLAHVKSPQGKMKIQLKQFEGLLKRDPAAAEEKAKELPKGWAKEDQLAALARHHFKDNPEKAVEIAAFILQENGGLDSRYTWIYREGGSSGSGIGNDPIPSLLNQLTTSHGEALIEKVLTEEGGYATVANAWAQQDLSGFAAWTNKQDNPDIYRNSALIVVSQLTEKRHYSEAMDWAQSLQTEETTSVPYQTRNTYRRWFQANPDEARTWKENASFDEAQVEQFNKVEQENQ
ncbi:MAG: hypothetical protein ACJAVK_003221, partial [Akkermansiaceae bacterium]